MFLDFLIGGAGFSTDDRTWLARVERKLDAIIAHLGVVVPTPSPAVGMSPEAIRLADAGEKIQAIKQYREDTGAGLAEAKRAVEEYIAGR